MIRNLKLYTADLVDTIDGVVGISIVKEPANRGVFSVVEDNGDSMLVATPIIVANVPIYRNNGTYGEHYVVFTQDVIKSAMEKATESKTIYTYDVEHNEQPIEGIMLTQSFLIDYDKGITAYKGLCGLTDGTWVGLFKVTDKTLIEGIKNGTYNGISVSMYATYEEVSLQDAIDMYNYLMKF